MILRSIKNIAFTSFLIVFCVNCSTKVEEEEMFLGIGESNAIDVQPKWLETGEWIFYLHGPDENTPSSDPSGIYKIKPNGSEKTLISSLTPSEIDANRDGSKLVFPIGGTKIYVMDLVLDTTYSISAPNKNFNTRLSPNDRYISYSKNPCVEEAPCGLWLYDSVENSHTLIYEYGFEGVWISENKLVFLTDEFNNIGARRGSLLWEIDVSNGLLKQKKLITESIRDLRYSTASNSLLGWCADRISICIYTLEGDFLQEIYDSKLIKGPGDWSPDGNHIVYTDLSKGGGYLWIMDKDGNNKRQLTN